MLLKKELCLRLTESVSYTSDYNCAFWNTWVKCGNSQILFCSLLLWWEEIRIFYISYGSYKDVDYETSFTDWAFLLQTRGK